MRGADSYSDHFLVRSKLKEKLSTKWLNAKEKSKKSDINRFGKPEKAEEYKEVIRNKIQMPQTKNNIENLTNENKKAWTIAKKLLRRKKKW